MTDVTETVRGVRPSSVHWRSSPTSREEALGLMTGALVHDFRNVLLVLSNSAEFLLGEAPPESDLADEASLVAESVEHARKAGGRRTWIFASHGTRGGGLRTGSGLEALRRLLRRLPGARTRVSLASSDSKTGSGWCTATSSRSS